MCLIFFFAAQPSLANSACQDLVGTCAYYECIEDNHLACGGDGYLLGFGLYYCNKFSDQNFRSLKSPMRQEIFPVNGNKWRDDVRECLQVQMETYLSDNQESLTCEGLKDFAFGSHPACYTGTNSFCSLPPESILAVGLTLEPQELRDPAVWRQMTETAEICVRQTELRRNQTKSLWLKFELNNVKLLWQAVARNPLGILMKYNSSEDPKDDQ